MTDRAIVLSCLVFTIRGRRLQYRDIDSQNRLHIDNVSLLAEELVIGGATFRRGWLESLAGLLIPRKPSTGLARRFQSKLPVRGFKGPRSSVDKVSPMVSSSQKPLLTRRDMLGVAISAVAIKPFAASAATPISQGAPAFGTSESRTGLLDGIKSSFSDKSGEALKRDYERNPVDVSGVSLPEACMKARDVAIIFHGSGGPDRETSALLDRFRQQDAAAGLKREAIVFNWMPWFTSNTNRLSFQSTNVGEALGAKLASNQLLRSLHIVGTSAGSFAANACCSSYVEAAGGANAKRARVRLTLADPFAARDGASFKQGRGSQFFGKDADFAEHILNTDDPVPNTDVPLPLCYCYDVTGSAERKTFPPPDKTGDIVYDFILSSLGYHSWPMGYLARHYETQLEKGQLAWPSHESKPRGSVEKVA